ncbi:MAG: SGNH/GDSL hydrolase family protein [Xanthomonadaceae bacterium]|nr:SGNH/GDSL hydrolase family protein [Xanthomonadaceae bacterium]
MASEPPASDRRFRVVLIGDSIRMNAEPFLRRRLSGDIELFAPPTNCESSRKVLAHLREWVPVGSAELVHLNCGLHDLRYDAGRDLSVCTLDEYAANLEAIFVYLRDTGAMLVWATSTPFDEATHNRTKTSRRYAADMQAYNARSVEIARRYGATIHDLHATLSRMRLEELWLPDGLHFNRAGCDAVGAAMAEVIMQAAAAQRSSAYSG